MKTKALFVTFLLSLFLYIACRPYYFCYIANYSSFNAKVKISPSLDSLKLFLSENYSDSLHQKAIMHNTNFSVFEILPNDKLHFFTSLGVIPHEKSFHINKIEIYTADTIIVLGSKEKIISAFEKDPKKRVHKIIIE